MILRRAGSASALKTRLSRSSRLVPVVDLEVIRRWFTATCFDQLPETQHEGRPLHAAMGHELDRLAPAPVAEEQDGVIAVLVEIEGRVGSDPLLGPRLESPLDPLVGFQCGDLHGHAADLLAAGSEEPNVHLIPDLGTAGCLLRPPARDTFDGRNCFINLRKRCLDAYAMND